MAPNCNECGMDCGHMWGCSHTSPDSPMRRRMLAQESLREAAEREQEIKDLLGLGDYEYAKGSYVDEAVIIAAGAAVTMKTREINDFDDVIDRPRAWPGRRMTCTVWPQTPPLQLGDLVTMKDQPLGRVTVVHPDGTTDVVFDAIGGGNADAAIVEAIQNNRKHIDRAIITDQTSEPDSVPYVDGYSIGLPSAKDDKPECSECKGTGYWTNPAGGRNPTSPCSQGCKPK